MKRIAVTGGGGRVSYGLLFQLAHGDLFGPKEKIALHICDLPDMQGALEAIAMELEDGAYPLLEEIRIGSDLFDLFQGIDIAFLVGAKPRGPGMERCDLLQQNGKIFIEVGKALNESASKDVKVMVAGNPCNTNCLIAMSHAPSIPRKNFHAMMRLDNNRAKSILAKKGDISVSDVTKMTIWGNHSPTQVPDYSHALLQGKSAEELLDSQWLHEEFMVKVQKRGGEIIRACGKSSAASASKAAIDAIGSLFLPTPQDDWFSSAVCSSENPYGIEENLIFGFPCRSKGDGGYEIVADLSLSDKIREKIALTEKELVKERECIKEMLGEL